jgi:rubredoxin
MAWREAQASTVTVFPGFLHVSFVCPACGAKWEGIAAIGVEGVQCPKCGAHDESFVWLPDDDDPQRATMPHDGCWLTGEFVPVEMQGEEKPVSEYSLVARVLVWCVTGLVRLIERVR